MGAMSSKLLLTPTSCDNVKYQTIKGVATSISDRTVDGTRSHWLLVTDDNGSVRDITVHPSKRLILKKLKMCTNTTFLFDVIVWDHMTDEACWPDLLPGPSGSSHPSGSSEPLRHSRIARSKLPTHPSRVDQTPSDRTVRIDGPPLPRIARDKTPPPPSHTPDSLAGSGSARRLCQAGGAVRGGRCVGLAFGVGRPAWGGVSDGRAESTIQSDRRRARQGPLVQEPKYSGTTACCSELGGCSRLCFVPAANTEGPSHPHQVLAFLTFGST